MMENKASIFCDECGHSCACHMEEGCIADRKIEADGIEIDGPCGCTAVTFEVEAKEEDICL